MRTMILIGGLFVLSPALATSTKLDLSERIQFSRNPGNTVTFEYCKLRSCEKINIRPIDQKALVSISDPVNLPSGIANQILTDAGVNAEKNMTAFEYGFAGAVRGAGEIRRAICNDKEIKETLAKAKRKVDYIFEYDLKKCTRSGTSAPINEEAEMLKKILKPLLQ